VSLKDSSVHEIDLINSDFPQMSKLARLTGGATEDIHDNTAVEEVDDEPMSSECFPRFSEFPPEIRLMIWFVLNFHPSYSFHGLELFWKC
jgi:hypothetical protein